MCILFSNIFRSNSKSAKYMLVRKKTTQLPLLYRAEYCYLVYIDKLLFSWVYIIKVYCFFTLRKTQKTNTEYTIYTQLVCLMSRCTFGFLKVLKSNYVRAYVNSIEQKFYLHLRFILKIFPHLGF